MPDAGFPLIFHREMSSMFMAFASRESPVTKTTNTLLEAERISFRDGRAGMSKNPQKKAATVKIDVFFNMN
jgi:hypothetical protein